MRLIITGWPVSLSPIFCCNQFGEFPRLVGRYATAASYCPSRPGEIPKLILTEYKDSSWRVLHSQKKSCYQNSVPILHTRGEIVENMILQAYRSQWLAWGRCQKFPSAVPLSLDRRKSMLICSCQPSSMKAQIRGPCRRFHIWAMVHTREVMWRMHARI